MRDNLTLFLKAASDYGVPVNELFQTVDLFEKKNVAQVTICLFALGREVNLFIEFLNIDSINIRNIFFFSLKIFKAQKKKYNGPALGPKPAEENKREFTEEQLRASEGMVGLQGILKRFFIQFIIVYIINFLNICFL